MVEAFTGGLAGHGRADPAEGWGATVFLQIMDPNAFGGKSAYERQMDQVVANCHKSTPANPDHQVRMPGERGLQHKAESLLKGLTLYPSIMPMLLPWASKFKLEAPQAI
jgi:L-lactate dehydrogenase